MYCTDAAWWQKLVSTHVSSSLLLVCAIGYSNSKSPNDNEGFGRFSQAGRTESVDSTQLCLEATHKTWKSLDCLCLILYYIFLQMSCMIHLWKKISKRKNKRSFFPYNHPFHALIHIILQIIWYRAWNCLFWCTKHISNWLSTCYLHL